MSSVKHDDGADKIDCRKEIELLLFVVCGDTTGLLAFDLIPFFVKLEVGISWIVAAFPWVE